MFDHLPLSWRTVALPLSPLLLLVAVALFSLLHLRRRARAIRPMNRVIPSPRCLPLIGNLHQLGSLPHRSLRTLSHKHGPVMLLHFGRRPTIVVSSSAAAAEVLKTHDHVFASRPYTSVGNRLSYGSRNITFSMYGDYWRQLRRICAVHLLNFRQVHSFCLIREEEVALLVERIRAASGPVNISELLIALTSNVICTAAFGKKYADEKSDGRGRSTEFSELLAELMALLGSFPLRDFVPSLRWVDWLSGFDEKVRKTAADFDAFIEEVLEEHATKGDTSSEDDSSTMDFVDILLSLGSKDESEDTHLTRESIKALILDMFVGGTDTTYATIEWAMAELVRHPEKMKKAQEEIRGILRSEQKITEEMIQGMNYLKAVIKETLRLHSIVPLLVPRESMEDTQVQGHLIPKGTRVIVNAWAIARDPNTWEKAEEFWPERFLNGNSVDVKAPMGFQFLPFGAGRRQCPGKDFALPIAELALANLLFHFDWDLPEETKEMDMSENFGLVMRKKSSLILVPKSAN